MLLCKFLDFARHNIHFQVSVEVIVSNVRGCIDHVPEYFVLELYNAYITLVQPQSWILYVQTGFSICLYRRSLFRMDSAESLPISQYILRSISRRKISSLSKSVSFCFCAQDMNRETVRLRSTSSAQCIFVTNNKRH